MTSIWGIKRSLVYVLLDFKIRNAPNHPGLAIVFFLVFCPRSCHGNQGLAEAAEICWPLIEDNYNMEDGSILNSFFLAIPNLGESHLHLKREVFLVKVDAKISTKWNRNENELFVQYHCLLKLL